MKPTTFVRRALVAAVLTPAVLVGCTPSPAAPPTAPSTGAEVGEHTVRETVPAPSLANNVLGDPAERDIIVYLPPSYHTSDARYPVVYYLAGYTERVGTFLPHTAVLWDAMTQEGMQELILVEVDGISALGGNFYANSPVSGNAADFLTRDLIAHVDAAYRTVPEASARGLTGFSMGGSGTINVGLANPDVFGALYAHSPGLLHEDGGLEDMLASNGVWQPYGAAFAPDLDSPDHMRAVDRDVPLAEQDAEVVAAWESGFGNLRGKLDEYLAGPDRLSEIRVAYGTADSYRWIPIGSEYFVGLLAERGVPHSVREYPGGHAVDYLYFQSDLVAFFSEQLHP